MKLGMENPIVEVIVVTLKFKDLSEYEMRALSPPIKEDIINIFTNYFGFDVMAYGSPIELEFKAQAWVNF
jgi:TolB-like protein